MKLWEVTTPTGSCRYRGPDLDLADEIYHSAPAGSHLCECATDAWACTRCGRPVTVSTGWVQGGAVRCEDHAERVTVLAPLGRPTSPVGTS
jgi:hypothetical protein